LDEDMIVLKNVVKRYKVGRSVIRALDNVSLNIRSGDFVAIQGPSGSGKTTLLNVVGCIDSPDSGTVRLDGQDVGRLPEGKLGRIRLERLGFVFQQFHLIPVLTALDNVILPMKEAKIPRAVRRKRGEELLSLVGLEKRMDHRPHQLSGGEMQRVCIARALANRPKVLLADEPTGEIDSKTSARIMKLFRSLNGKQGLTVLLVTHDLAVAKQANRTITMVDGRIR